MAERLFAIGVRVVLWMAVGLAAGGLVEPLTVTATRAADQAIPHKGTADALAS